jgi:uncharacterized membrane protein
METLLMVVTVVALGLAIGMAVLAWRLLRDDRRRAVARADALRALATSDAAGDAVEVAGDSGQLDDSEIMPVATSSSTSASGLGLAAWPSKAHASPSAVEAWDLGLGQDRSLRAKGFWPQASAPKPHALQQTLESAAPMFGATEEHGAPARRWMVLAAVVGVMAMIVGVVYVIHQSAVSASAESIQTTAAAPTPSGQPRPLELLSLRHAVDADGSFTVTGLVQNPFDGRIVRRAVAVVYLFDREGNYFASGKASLDFTSLQPGDESPFVVRVTNVSHVSRYRVGFRSEDGGVIAHVDRRGQLPGGTTGDAIEARPTVPATRRSEG